MISAASRAELDSLIATRGVILYWFLCFHKKKVRSSHREDDVLLERRGYDSEVIHSWKDHSTSLVATLNYPMNWIFQ